jgi:hypothetical protein
VNDSDDNHERRHGTEDCRRASAPQAAAFPPFAPFPPYPQFPPFPPFPAPPCYPPSPCRQADSSSISSSEVYPDQPGDTHEPSDNGGEASTPGGDTGAGGIPPLVFPSSIEIRRPDDLLVCTLRFTGFVFLQDPPRLDRVADDAYITFEFPPQSFGEEAFLQTTAQVFNDGGQPVQPLEVTPNKDYPPQNVPGTTDDPLPTTLPAARIRMAEPSRVVVSMPPAQNSIVFDLPTMLSALRDWPMRLAVAAVPDAAANDSGVDWLGKLVGQEAWATLRFEMFGFLSQLAGTTSQTGTTLADTIAAHADQLAQQTAIGISAPPATGTLRDALQNALVAATTALQQRYPALQTTAGSTAAMAVLSLATLEALRGSPGAVPANAAQLQDLPFVSLLLGPQAPPNNVTVLELPYRLLTTPLNPAQWRHSLTPVTQRGRTELWHTRLDSSDVPAGPDLPSRIRAIWSPDYRPPEKLDELYKLISAPGQPGKPNPNLIRMGLDLVDRAMLVTLMAGFDAKRNLTAAYEPMSSEAKRLHLTSLGALLDAEGSWNALPDGIDLEQWRHQASLGRDHYVRVVYAGWLCPFGHAASLVKVTERRFQSLLPNGPQRIAVLRQRFFLVVREPVRGYAGVNHAHAGRDFPFTSVEILTRVTPDLADPGMGASHLAKASVLDPYDKIAPRMLFWPMVPAASGLVDVPFEIAATDLAGNRVTFAMPLLFVGKPANERASDAEPLKAAYHAALRAAYNAAPPGQKRRATLGGAVVAYAPSVPTDKGDPKLPTADITFRAGAVLAEAQPNFYPEVDRAHVGVKPVQKLLAKPDFLVEVAYPDFYAQHGLDPTANAGQVFLQFTSAVPLVFGGKPTDAKSDALGALASPQMNLLGLSKIMGPVAGKTAADVAGVQAALDKVSKAQFDPSEFFGDATLLGGIKLGDIVASSMSLAGAEVPKMLARDLPDRVEASFDWDTTVGSGSTLLIPRADPGGPETKLVMHGTVRTPHDPAVAPGFEATAVLNNFKVNLFGFIILWFEQLSFAAKSGQKSDVSVQLRAGSDAVTFGGPLEFVNTLRSVIPGNGFSDPPGISVTPSGISASYSLTLPALEVGVFALANASLSASFSLPFDGTPANVKFYFSRREQPFSLTVSLLGGGGFFGIGISSSGVDEIEAALEFGAALSIDLGVASGSVEVKAGIYFHWLEPAPGKGSVELAGYVRIHGELCVLALISVSLTFNLQLGYLKEGGKSIVYGEAELTVEIDILMFSTSVSVRCRREFSGGSSDPKFIEQIPTAAIWDEYCEAFASEIA